MSRTLPFVSLVVTFVFFAVGTVVLADPPTVSIQQQAELIPGFGILVHVVVNCGDGETDGTIDVAARQRDFASENVDTVLSMGGQVQLVAPGAPVPGAPGPASAATIDARRRSTQWL